MSKSCQHEAYNVLPSENANQVNYNLRTAKQLQTAAAVPKTWTKDNGKAIQNVKAENMTCDYAYSASFPAPLLLPDDDLAVDPKYPPQSVRSWISEPDRNRVTADRKTIYVAAPSLANKDLSFINEWTDICYVSSSDVPQRIINRPEIQNVMEYLSSFYHGLPVKKLATELCFCLWDEGKKKSSKKTKIPPKLIGLRTSTECTGIRVREKQDGPFNCQLNLNDLLDITINVLPDDAYALLLLVDHDLYEDDDDDFACGRAYGGSRVAVVSTARYHPNLDIEQDVEQVHAWPASHCSKYLRDECKELSGNKKSKAISNDVNNDNNASPEPIKCAISAYNKLTSPTQNNTPAEILSTLWLSRVCRTASHELGHCFGIDHCVYYACCMQGTTSLKEDVRQPPYLCPVDLTKVLLATGSSVKDHYEAQLKYCEKHEKTQMFAAYAAWLHCRLDGMEVL